LNKFLDDKRVDKIELHTLLMLLTYHKELDLNNEQEKEADEYIDAFVALGGNND
jgi:hypothetical protein